MKKIIKASFVVVISLFISSPAYSFSIGALLGSYIKCLKETNKLKEYKKEGYEIEIRNGEVTVIDKTGKEVKRISIAELNIEFKNQIKGVKNIITTLVEVKSPIEIDAENTLTPEKALEFKEKLYVRYLDHIVKTKRILNEINSSGGGKIQLDQLPEYKFPKNLVNEKEVDACLNDSEFIEGNENIETENNLIKEDIKPEMNHYDILKLSMLRFLNMSENSEQSNLELVKKVVDKLIENPTLFSDKKTQSLLIDNGLYNELVSMIKDVSIKERTRAWTLDVFDILLAYQKHANPELSIEQSWLLQNVIKQYEVVVSILRSIDEKFEPIIVNKEKLSNEIIKYLQKNDLGIPEEKYIEDLVVDFLEKFYTKFEKGEGISEAEYKILTGENSLIDYLSEIAYKEYKANKTESAFDYLYIIEDVKNMVKADLQRNVELANKAALLYEIHKIIAKVDIKIKPFRAEIEKAKANIAMELDYILTGGPIDTDPHGSNRNIYGEGNDQIGTFDAGERSLEAPNDKAVLLSSKIKSKLMTKPSVVIEFGDIDKTHEAEEVKFTEAAEIKVKIDKDQERSILGDDSGKLEGNKIINNFKSNENLTNNKSTPVPDKNKESRFTSEENLPVNKVNAKDKSVNKREYKFDPKYSGKVVNDLKKQVKIQSNKQYENIAKSNKQTSKGKTARKIEEKNAKKTGKVYTKEGSYKYREKFIR